MNMSSAQDKHGPSARNVKVKVASPRASNKKREHTSKQLWRWFPLKRSSAPIPRSAKDAPESGAAGYSASASASAAASPLPALRRELYAADALRPPEGWAPRPSRETAEFARVGLASPKKTWQHLATPSPPSLGPPCPRIKEQAGGEV